MYLYKPVLIKLELFFGVGKGDRFLFNCKIATIMITTPWSAIRSDMTCINNPVSKGQK